MAVDRRAKGVKGEEAALEYFLAQGYTLLERNFRAEGCEIDLIMGDGETVVFIEVKARSSGRFGLGREAVGKAKQNNIIRAAVSYAVKNGLMDAALRFDVAEVSLPDLHVTQIVDAFQT